MSWIIWFSIGCKHVHYILNFSFVWASCQWSKLASSKFTCNPLSFILFPYVLYVFIFDVFDETIHFVVWELKFCSIASMTNKDMYGPDFIQKEKRRNCMDQKCMLIRATSWITLIPRTRPKERVSFNHCKQIKDKHCVVLCLAYFSFTQLREYVFHRNRNLLYFLEFIPVSNSEDLLWTGFQISTTLLKAYSLDYVLVSGAIQRPMLMLSVKTVLIISWSIFL